MRWPAVCTTNVSARVVRRRRLPWRRAHSKCWRARGRRVEVPPDCSIAAALIRAGVDVPLSCEQGVCGMCMTRVIDGIPDHRDDVLSEAERASNGVILPCVSRAKSALLTLDL